MGIENTSKCLQINISFGLVIDFVLNVLRRLSLLTLNTMSLVSNFET